MKTISLQKALPVTDEPLVVPPTGKVRQSWREYLESLDRALRALIHAFGTGSTTVAALPDPALLGAGARAFVTDADDTTFLSVVNGGGSNAVPVVSNGTDWLIG